MERWSSHNNEKEQEYCTKMHLGSSLVYVSCKTGLIISKLLLLHHWGKDGNHNLEILSDLSTETASNLMS